MRNVCKSTALFAVRVRHCAARGSREMGESGDVRAFDARSDRDSFRFEAPGGRWLRDVINSCSHWCSQSVALQVAVAVSPAEIRVYLDQGPAQASHRRGTGVAARAAGQRPRCDSAFCAPEAVRRSAALCAALATPCGPGRLPAALVALREREQKGRGVTCHVVPSSLRVVRRYARWRKGRERERVSERE